MPKRGSVSKRMDEGVLTNRIIKAIIEKSFCLLIF